MKWMPIETAPRDGTMVIVTGRGYPYVACYCSGEWGYATDYCGMDIVIKEELTHWMPLPEPPNE